MNSVLLKSWNLTKEKIYIMIIWLFILFGILGCFQKIVTHEFISKDSQYIPEEMAIEYLNHFFDVNPEGILLEKRKGSFSLKNFYERFPLQDTTFIIENPTSDLYWIKIKHKDNFKSGDRRGFHKWVLIRGREKVKKICAAINSLGASFVE